MTKRSSGDYPAPFFCQPSFCHPIVLYVGLAFVLREILSIAVLLDDVAAVVRDELEAKSIDRRARRAVTRRRPGRVEQSVRNFHGEGSGDEDQLLHALWRGRGRFSHLPLAGGWTQARDLPAPQGRSFQSLWRDRGVDRGPNRPRWF